MISYDFGMHRAGVLQDLLLLARRGDRRRVLVMGVLRDPRVGYRQRHYTHDYCCNVCSHIVWL
jgi:hypothetical protein